VQKGGRRIEDPALSVGAPSDDLVPGAQSGKGERARGGEDEQGDRVEAAKRACLPVSVF
jgi:hypothetical protein